jgi:hypothetical protein
VTLVEHELATLEPPDVRLAVGAVPVRIRARDGGNDREVVGRRR